VECEVDSITQIAPVLEAGADVILFDNFSVAELRAALALVNGQAWTEISGGVTLDGLPEIAHLGADFISTGAVTHRVAWVDIGVDWEE
jgi:nicotinate-nucleotide pyrophosphorylase (carboxylating)